METCRRDTPLYLHLGGKLYPGVCRRFEHQAEAHYALVMTDKGATELFSITTAEPASDLARLWENSRQVALNLRQKIEKLNDIPGQALGDFFQDDETIQITAAHRWCYDASSPMAA